MSQINNLEELLLLYSTGYNKDGGKWNYYSLSCNPSILERMVDIFIHEKWNYDQLSKNPAISINYILKNPLKAWKVLHFVRNPGLDVHKIATIIQTEGTVRLHQFIPHQLTWICQQEYCCKNNKESLHYFIDLMTADHAPWQSCQYRNFEGRYAADPDHICIQCLINNKFLIHNKFIPKIFGMLLDNPFLFDSIKTKLGLMIQNLNIGSSLLYCIAKVMHDVNCFDERDPFIPEFAYNRNADERTIDLFFTDTTRYTGVNAYDNCISLKYLIQTNRWGWTIGWTRHNVQNPSIIQSIYQIYNNFFEYFKGKIPNDLFTNVNYNANIQEIVKEFEAREVEKVMEMSPYHAMYHEHNIVFTQEHFLKFYSLTNGIVLPNFSMNPNLDWELLTNYTWKEYDFYLLSSNPFQQHLHYRKAEISNQLSAIGISLLWNELDEQVNDDCMTINLLKKVKYLSSTTTTTTKRMKR